MIIVAALTIAFRHSFNHHDPVDIAYHVLSDVKECVIIVPEGTGLWKLLRTKPSDPKSESRPNPFVRLHQYLNKHKESRIKAAISQKPSGKPDSHSHVAYTTATGPNIPNEEIKSSRRRKSSTEKGDDVV